MSSKHCPCKDLPEKSKAEKNVFSCPVSLNSFEIGQWLVNFLLKWFNNLFHDRQCNIGKCTMMPETLVY